MSQLSARFQQTISEVKRYELDYTAQLQPGESVTSIVPSITSPTGAPVSPAFVVNNIAITPQGNQATFFASGGADLNSYEVKFLATTSLAQVFEDVVWFDLVDKV